MINLRKMYPEYHDLPKKELIKRIHKKFYPDINYKVFLELIGETSTTDALNGIIDLLSKHGELLTKRPVEKEIIKSEPNMALVDAINRLSEKMDDIVPYDSWDFKITRNHMGFIIGVEANAK